MHLYDMVRTGLLRQIRSYPFLITIALTVFSGYALVPPADAGYTILQTGGVRGVYNSAWLGGIATLSSSVFLWLFGFYLLRNKISEDHHLNMGTLITSAPVRKTHYLLAKVVTNLLTLMLIHLVLIPLLIMMQFLRGESYQIQLLDYMLPFLLITVPSFTVLATLTVLFDIVPGLKGAVGNILYFLLWALLAAFSMEHIRQADVMGSQLIFSQILEQATVTFPFIDHNIGFGYLEVSTIHTFIWNGLVWTPQLIRERLVWIVVAVVIFFITVLIFPRSSLVAGKAKRTKEQATLLNIYSDPTELPMEKEGLSPLHTKKKYHFFPLLRSEILLILKGLPKWWYILSIAAIGGTMLIDYRELKEWLPITLLWPITIWSQMATRERHHRTEALLFSSGSPFLQLFSQWFAGYIITFALGIGITFSAITAHDGSFLVSWLVGLCFVPTLALALGVWSGTRKLFEVIYLLVWYMGPMQVESPLDFMGISQTEPLPFFYLGCTLLLFVVAVIGRKKQLKN
ncbi:hypothetical protein GXN76_03425 [Kroppenstedtia pulmonis]|uniref:Uncharacterized protein n=1 Tax=Kroppenstedtia pulmonis TaxID=1380685 RepID=A0A7D4CUR8_9BACL|nr:hypothetical protein [Kroppenstedtia pulmonis]QKG83617.1 hypothetical protein GXN76_03425 [Kroppenstedtia pulmonis]